MGRCRSIAIVFLCLLSLPAAAALSFIQPSPTPLVTMKNGNGAIELAAGAFNGDGKPDLAVTYSGVADAAAQATSRWSDRGGSHV